MDRECEKGLAEAQVHQHKNLNITRTEGDGMENVDGNEKFQIENEKRNICSRKPEYLRDKFIYSPEEFPNTSSKPPKITGRIIQLRPAPVVTRPSKPEQTFQLHHGKEPKFVPYEPYKCAVNPMVPHELIVRKKKTRKISTTSSADAVKQDGTRTLENLSPEESTSHLNHTVLPKTEKDEKELERLLKENQQLENQLKFQIQVNGDLKNLLVASVGEDMETRVHILTEDKLHLARALLSSAQKLNTHQEQTEWLASQCEVWRSKFLASSIMVEELAKWKALLTRRVQDLHITTKHLLEERLKVREYLISTNKDLGVLCDNFDVTSLRNGVHKLNSSNILDLSEVNMQLSAVVRLQLLGSGLAPPHPCEPGHAEPSTTVAEAAAVELIRHPIPELESADAAYSAVMGAAVALSSSSHLFSPACCGQCTGDIKTL